MKTEAILSFIKLPEGVEFDIKQLDLSSLEAEWNRQYNGMKVSVTKEASEKAVSDLLTEYGLDSKEAIKTLQDANKSKKDLEDTKFTELEEKFNQLTTNFDNKNAELTKQTQLSALGKMNIKADKLDKAYKLISSDVSDKKDFETIAKEFVESTPEWIQGSKKPGVNFANDDVNDGDETKTKEDAEALSGAW